MTDEATLWNYAWNHVVFGVQHELDVAEKQLFKEAVRVAKGNGKGTRVGKGARHWTAPAVYCSDHSPYPLELSVTRVDQIAYVWDECCDKFGESSKKCGDLKWPHTRAAPVCQRLLQKPQILRHDKCGTESNAAHVFVTPLAHI